jgi:hypothetical protein
MILTIRKYSKWLTIPLFTIIIIVFIFFMSAGPTRNNAGSTGAIDTNLVSGTIYGQKVTADEYYRADRDIDLDFLFNYGQWPDQQHDKNAIMQEIYLQMMMLRKAKEVGVHVGDAQVQQAAAEHLRSPALLRALRAPGQSIPFNAFEEQVLTPGGLTTADFENYIRDSLAVQELQLTFGLPGLLITPEEAAAEYIRQYQEISAEAVFFSASNYLSRALINPQEVGMYYTNYMANYRLPDRVQVSYVDFSASNYLARAQGELTNLDTQVGAVYSQYGMQIIPDAKTPDEAKAGIRKELLRRQALSDAAQQAGDFAQAVFNVSGSANKPASAQDLVTVAAKKGLQVETTAPFSADYGPQEFTAPPAFTQQSFALTPDSPLSEPVAGPYGVYVIALDRQLPTEIPPLDQIRSQVVGDMQMQEATLMALHEGTNFVHGLFVQMASGKSFVAASIAAGVEPQSLPPFSLATQDMPELEGHATMNQLKQTALVTPIGMASGFVQTQDGGFVLFVESKMPVDQAKMNADLPQFISQLRQQREVQTFSDWYQREANQQLHGTPLDHMK